MYVYATLALVGAFMIGSIPVGVLLARAFGLPDPRTIGSGNIGATNMLRTGNKKVALLTLLLDALKGVVGVLLLHSLLGHLVLAYWGAAFAVAGHCYSPWLNGKGGKGVATALGAIIALDAVSGSFGQMLLPLAICWGGIVFLRRYVSLASVATAAFFPVVALVSNHVLLPPLIIAIIIVWRHRENIARLRAGTEAKLGAKKDA